MQLSRILKNNSGFSLLELLIYMAILSGFLMVIVNLFFSISGSSSREEARKEVQQNLQFAFDTIANETRSASAITVPISGATGNILDITVNGDTTEYSVSNGILQRTRNAVIENVTTSEVTVDAANPIFTRIGNTIQIILTISYNDNGRGDYKFFKTDQTTVALKIN